MRDWAFIRAEYVEQGKSYTELAEEHSLSYGTLSRRGDKEGWTERRGEFLSRAELVSINDITRKLLKRIERTVDDESKLEVKDFKAVTGALKELRELQKPDAERGDTAAHTLTVSFLGEAEELSR